MEKENYCFVCSKVNSKGIHLNIKNNDDGMAKAEFTLQREYEGYPGIIHGGIIAAILDEVMGNIEFRKGYITYTVELNIKYLKKCLINEVLMAQGRVREFSHKIIKTEGEIVDPLGNVRVKATARYFVKKKSEQRGGL
jgi:uncharacterized protein (TIGR00369 family)